MLRELVAGRYELQITAPVAGVSYQVSVQAPDQAGKPAIARLAGRTAEPGLVDRYEIVYAPAATPALTLAEVAEPWRFRVILSSRAGATSEPSLSDPQGRPVGVHRALADMGNGKWPGRQRARCPPTHGWRLLAPGDGGRPGDLQPGPSRLESQRRGHRAARAP
jgi:hypothetical protein